MSWVITFNLFLKTGGDANEQEKLSNSILIDHNPIINRITICSDKIIEPPNYA